MKAGNAMVCMGIEITQRWILIAGKAAVTTIKILIGIEVEALAGVISARACRVIKAARGSVAYIMPEAHTARTMMATKATMADTAIVAV